jgi:lipopolysaccharide transport system ATP-binding protein
VVPNDQDLYLVIEGDVTELDPSLIVGYTVISEDGHTVYWSTQMDAGDASPRIVNGRNTLRARLPARFLNEGTYMIELMACLHNRFWILEPGTSGPLVTFCISGGMSDSPYWYQRRPGLAAPIIEWESMVEEMAHGKSRDELRAHREDSRTTR